MISFRGKSEVFDVGLPAADDHQVHKYYHKFVNETEIGKERT